MGCQKLLYDTLFTAHSFPFKYFETVDDEMPSASAISDVLYPDALSAPILFCLATLNVVVARGVAR